MNKEIDIEQIRALLEGYCEWCMAQGGHCQAKLDGCSIADAKALLKPCPMCRGSKRKPILKDSENAWISCPDCKDEPALEAHPLYEIAHTLENCCICYDVKMSEMPCNPPKCTPVIQARKLWRIILPPDHIAEANLKVSSDAGRQLGRRLKESIARTKEQRNYSQKLREELKTAKDEIERLKE